MARTRFKRSRIRTGPLQQDGLRVVSEGLKPDDWVVVGALQQIRPRLTVKTDQIPMPIIGPVQDADASGSKPMPQVDDKTKSNGNPK